MSNQRKPALWDAYRTECLRSAVWFARRDRWFAHETVIAWPLTCAGCGQEATKRQLELHHLDYAGVRLDDGTWTAHEPHEDILAMHPYCHELLHRLIDRDAVLSRHVSRPTASVRALARLRAKLTLFQESG